MNIVLNDMMTLMTPAAGKQQSKHKQLDNLCNISSQIKHSPTENKEYMLPILAFLEGV
jgi:hypothetical protein